jgi:hypothetical protein
VTTTAETYRKLLEGRRTPMQERQERYDRFLEWQRKGLSMAEIADRWRMETGGVITRQRVGKILGEPRPGTFSKGSELAAAERRVRDLKERIGRWSKRDTPAARDRTREMRQELQDATRALAAARAQARRVSKVTPD